MLICLISNTLRISAEKLDEKKWREKTLKSNLSVNEKTKLASLVCLSGTVRREQKPTCKD